MSELEKKKSRDRNRIIFLILLTLACGGAYYYDAQRCDPFLPLNPSKVRSAWKVAFKNTAEYKSIPKFLEEIEWEQNNNEKTCKFDIRSEDICVPKTLSLNSITQTFNQLNVSDEWGGGVGPCNEPPPELSKTGITRYGYDMEKPPFCPGYASNDLELEFEYTRFAPFVDVSEQSPDSHLSNKIKSKDISYSVMEKTDFRMCTSSDDTNCMLMDDATKVYCGRIKEDALFIDGIPESKVRPEDVVSSALYYKMIIDNRTDLSKFTNCGIPSSRTYVYGAFDFFITKDTYKVQSGLIKNVDTSLYSEIKKRIEKSPDRTVCNVVRAGAEINPYYLLSMTFPVFAAYQNLDSDEVQASPLLAPIYNAHKTDAKLKKLLPSFYDQEEKWEDIKWIKEVLKKAFKNPRSSRKKMIAPESSSLEIEKFARSILGFGAYEVKNYSKNAFDLVKRENSFFKGVYELYSFRILDDDELNTYYSECDKDKAACTFFGIVSPSKQIGKDVVNTPNPNVDPSAIVMYVNQQIKGDKKKCSKMALQQIADSNSDASSASIVNEFRALTGVNPLNGLSWGKETRPGGLLPKKEASNMMNDVPYPNPSLVYAQDRPANCTIRLGYSPKVLEDVAKTIRDQLAEVDINVEPVLVTQGTNYDILLESELYFKPSGICYLWNWVDPNNAKGRLENPFDECLLNDLERWHAACTGASEIRRKNSCKNNDQLLMNMKVAYFEERYQRSSSPALVLDYFQPYVLNTSEKKTSMLIQSAQEIEPQESN
ncbi:MAG: hypothetical protein CL916_00050 [Deltaproteobacteria bacterium]|nr:hypothetical protein [Deltaproteobacteria bacterium]